MISLRCVETYCCEDISLIENYEKAIADDNTMWDCHHRLEIQGNISTSVQTLKDKGLYFNRPACELIFLTHSDHTALHAPFKIITEEHKRKIGDANRGRVPSEETRKKISEANKGQISCRKGIKMTEEQKEKCRLSAHSRPIVCVETGIIYRSARDIEKQFGIQHNYILRCCKGYYAHKTAGGYHWEYAKQDGGQ